MKKILFLMLGLLVTFTIKAQSYSVLNSASGELVKFETIYDEENDIFGYVELRKLDLINELTENYKYVILDKNMNSICSGEFTETLFKKKCYKKLTQVVFCDSKLLFVFRQTLESSNALNNSYQILDIKQNKIISNGIFISNTNDSKNENKLNKAYHPKYFRALSKIGFISRIEDGSVYSAIGFDAVSLWIQPIKVVDEKEKYEYSYYSSNEKFTIINVTKKLKDKKISDHALILDTKTGKEIAFLKISDDDYTTIYYTIKIIKEEVITVGKYYEKDKRDEVDYKESLGLYRQIIDIKSGKITNKDFLPYGKFGNLDISENGKIKKEGYMSFQEIDINPDGSYFVLAETYFPKAKIDIFSSVYVFQLNKDFVPIKVTNYDTENARGSKYSFSQKLIGDKGKAFFFYDKDEDKKIELNILTLNYATGAILQSKMPITNEKTAIKVERAKIGYVALIEYFKDSKKDGKAVEIRLEKINNERQ